MEVFVGIAGGSGAPYARGLVAALIAAGHTVGASFTESGSTVVGHELYDDLRMPRAEVIARFCDETGLAPEHVWGLTDWSAPYASGSARWDAAVICPASMDTVAAIAMGSAANLLQRAALVAQKEARQLIVVPRETPFSQIQLENLLRLSRAGVHIVPAMPAFYTRPKTIDDMVDFMVGKVLNLLGVEQTALAEWRDQ